ncbi:MAG: DUF368 domain-containing protein [Suipraeoptans sp.]
MWIRNMFQGFCMAMADSVPGVSGGSIAFLMGFYNEFITSLNNITSRDGSKRKEAFIFLIKLGIGWIIGMGLAVTVLASVFDKYIYQISSLFLGFIIVAIVVMFVENKKKMKINGAGILCMILGMTIVIAVTILNQNISGSTDLSKLDFSTVLYVFFSAMVAISAMVLPGISGSTLLLVFGLYVPVITAVKSLLQFDFSVLPAIIVFGLGALTGIILFVRWIKLALEKFPSQTMFTIIGLMVGSLYSITMGPTTLKEPMPAMNISSFSVVFFLIGCILVIGLEFYKRSMENKKK